MNNTSYKFTLSKSKISRLFNFILIWLFLLLPLQARLRFIGPNPYYSFLTFPQDSQLFRTRASIFFLYYRSRGWMGHLDTPEVSPSPTYVATEESVTENFQQTTTATAGFKGSWRIPRIMTAPFIFNFKSIRIIPLISGQLDIFNLHSSGEAITHEEGQSRLIPFTSELSQRNHQYSLALVTSATIKNIPIGFIINYKHLSESNPSGYLKFTQNGIETKLNRFNWGWSTAVGCNHIFGVKTNIDAFWQDEYTQSRISQLDFVLGTDIQEHKLGIRVRRALEYGNFYSYSDTLNRYVKNDLCQKVSSTMLRSYDIMKITDIGAATLYLCGVVEVDFIGKKYLREDTDFLDHYRENDYGLEFLPFLHFDLPRGGFLRIGTSASFFWKDYRYQDIWGDQKVYSPSWPHFGWETSWERSSYGHRFAFINFTEADLELPVFDKWNLLLSVDLWSHQVYAKTTRYYGKNISNNDVYNFHQTAERKNILKESWFGGTFGLFIGHKLSLGLFLDLPVYYDKLVSTEIKGEEGDIFIGFSDAQPAIRQPVGFWAMIIMRW